MSRSETLFAKARACIPGGVNSPVRAFNSVGGTPVYMASGKGAYLLTADGDTLIDFCGSWGPLILGHARDEVVKAASDAAAKGMSFGANTASEIDFAMLIADLIPYVEKVRLVSSGTEATMTALRMARGITGRDKVVKFNGGYHGHSDGLLVSAGSGLLTGGITSSAGVSKSVAETVFVPHYNDLAGVRRIMEAHGNDIAAIIVEPVAGNMGLVLPEPGFLEGLRELADSCGTMLVFDEVITGFRSGPTTYGSILGVTPDLTCLGKIIGGGMPIGAIAGRSKPMEILAPNGPVYQAGTLSGNPVAVAAGLRTLELLVSENPYPRLAALGRQLANGINGLAKTHDVPMHCASLGGAFTCFFRSETVRNIDDAKACDLDLFRRFYHQMLGQGIYLPPSQFETAFISAAHSDEDVDAFIQAADASLGALVRS